MSAPARGRRRQHHEEEGHGDSERWLVTYADMLTVLMALFIVLFALSVADKKKFDAFAAGARGEIPAGGQSLLEGGTGVQDAGAGISLDVHAAAAALKEKESLASRVAAERADLEEAREKIRAALDKKQMADAVRFKIDERGLVVTIITDEVMFDLGSATLRPSGAAVLDAVAPALKSLTNPVTVEGHTDNLPIRGGRFATNWELSAERATSVLRYVLDRHKVPAKRLSAAGYADQRPVAPNSPAGRPANRRVEVIVRATAVTAPVASAPAPAAVRPAAQLSTPTTPSTTNAVAGKEKH